MNYIRLLRRNPSFARLWAASAISFLGDWFDLIAISALVANFTNGSGLAITLLLLARFVPPLFIGSFAGVLADRLNRKHLLIFSDLARAVVVLLLLFGSSPNLLWLVYLLTIMQSALTAVFEPASAAILPSVVAQEDLIAANTLSSTTWSVMLAAGAAIGGSVAAVLGTQTALIIDAVSFVVSALLIIPIHYTPPADTSVSAIKTDSASAFGGLVEGLRYIRSRLDILATIFVKAGGSIGNIDALLTIYATQIYIIGEDGAGSLGILYAAFGVGALLGPIVAERIIDGSIRHMRIVTLIAFFLILVSWLLIGISTSLAAVTFAIFIRAIGNSLAWTYSAVMLQKQTPDHYLGRVSSIDMILYRVATIFGTVLTGLVIQAAQNGVPATDTVLLTARTVEASGQINLISGLISIVPLLLWYVATVSLNRRELRAA